MSKKILILHGINYWNVGDLGITDAMVYVLQKYKPEHEIIIATPYANWTKPENTKIDFKITEKADIVLFPSKEKHTLFIKKIYNLINLSFTAGLLLFYGLIYKIVKLKINFLLNKKQKEIVKEYFEAEIIISKGGGFLYYNKKFLISPHLLPIIFAKLLNKPVVIYAQSLGPYKKGFSEKIYKYVFKKIDLIIVREELSKEILSKMGINSVLGTDAAFALQELDDENKKNEINNFILQKKENYEFVVGMSILDWNFPNYAKDETKIKKKNYINSIVANINYINKNYKTYFLFFPHSISGLEKDDREIIKKIINKSELKNNFEIYQPENNPRILNYILGKLDFCIGTRMHSNIFTMLGGTPLIAISYLPKTEGIMKKLNLEDLTLKIDEVNPEKIIEKTKILINSLDNIKKRINNSIEKEKELAIKNTSYLDGLFDR